MGAWIILILATVLVLSSIAGNHDKLNKKQKSKIRREVDLELGINPPKTTIFKNKKKYDRKEKHKKDEDGDS